jgi:carbonic anhydrase
MASSNIMTSSSCANTNSTAPIDITNNYDSTCDLKCEYTFKYPLTTLTLSNKGDYIYMTPEMSISPPVTYNANAYQVKEIRLYRNSLHTYAGQNADAELIIVHNNISGNGELLVCVPIMKSGTSGSSNTSGSSSMFDALISEMTKTANSVGQQTVFNNASFTLDKLVPMKPFFSYTGSLPYSPCSGSSYNYIVYNIDHAITMSKSAYKAFSKMIGVSQSQIQSGKGGLYYNKKGPKSSQGNEDEIYIECLPTGSSTEKILVEIDKSPESLFNFNISDAMNNGVVQILIGVILIVGIMEGGRRVLKNITTNNPN